MRRADACVVRAPLSLSLSPPRQPRRAISVAVAVSETRFPSVQRRHRSYLLSPTRHLSYLVVELVIPLPTSSLPLSRHRSLPLAPATMDITSLPPVTRLWALSSVAVSLLEHISLLSRYSLFYSPSLAFSPSHPQPHRCLTTFLYFGEFGIDFLFHLFFFIRYARMLEENHYAGQTASFAWLLLVCGALLLALSPLLSPPLPFLGSPLAFVLVYIWSRRNRHVRLSLFGVLVITAPYLPIALCAFSWILTGSATAVKGDLLGLAVGHVCECECRREVPARGKQRQAVCAPVRRAGRG